MTATIPDPALDGPDAERAIAEAFNAARVYPTNEQIDAAIAALNDRDVVLCDYAALIELRRQAKAHTSGGIVHRCPGESGLMPCCDRFPYEVSAWDRLSVTGQTVTCTGGAK